MDRKLILLALVPLVGAGFFALTSKTEVAKEQASPRYQELVGVWREKLSADPDAAYAAYLEAGASLPYIASHELSHIVGEELYALFGPAGLLRCTEHFAYGCYHGFSGRALEDHGLTVVDALKDGCYAKGRRTGFACIHGIGHGILSHVGNDRLETALRACEPVQKGEEQIAGCLGGVFMEYNYRTMQSVNGVDLRPLDTAAPYHPCTTVDDRFAAACYYELPSWRFALEGGRVESDDARLVGSYCASVDERYRTICYRGIGNVIGSRTEERVAVMKERCEAAGGGFDACFHEAVGFLLQTDQGRRNLQALCDEHVVPYEDTCRGARDTIGL